MTVQKCNHAQIGALEFNDEELAEALSSGIEFWGSGTCLKCKAFVDFQIMRGEVREVEEAGESFR